VEFFGAERVLFGTDTPFNTRVGGHLIRATISGVEAAVSDPTLQSEIFQGNAWRVLGIR
jgi:predicted TIM-barrel fold metal-dependent hydrolase